MFSAYDLKKIIPRAIFALILVNLSWSLMSIFIQGVHYLGEGAKDLVMAPFEKAGITGISFGGSGFGAGGTVLTLATLGAAGVVFGLIPVLAVAIAGLTGVLFAFVIALLRRVMLIGLVIISPIAISLMVFPQTESWAKKWWDWFSKLLLMYPFVMAFFGLSEVTSGLLSKISSSSASGFDSALYDLAAIAVLVAPYFLVGKALSLAGGAIGKVAGMVNNKDRGLIDKTKKWEQAKVAERRNDAKGGGRFDEGTLRGKVFNRPLRRVMNPASMKPWDSSAKRQAVLTTAFEQSVAKTEETNPGIKTLSGEEARALALARGSRSGAKQAEAKEGQKAKEEEMARLRRLDPGISDIQAEAEGEKAARAAEANYRNMLAVAERKAGTLDVVSSAAALQKAAEAGTVTLEESQRTAQYLGQTVAGGGRAGVELGRSLASGAAKTMAGKGHLVAGAMAGGGSTAAAVDKVLQSSTLKEIGGQTKESAQTMADVFIEQIQDAYSQMQTDLAAGNMEGAARSLQTIVTVQSNVETVRRAAGKEGNAGTQQHMERVLKTMTPQIDMADATARVTPDLQKALKDMLPTAPGAPSPTPAPGAPPPLPPSIAETVAGLTDRRMGS